jgi:glycosyltransferase involved in cell wall biosynthesis
MKAAEGKPGAATGEQGLESLAGSRILFVSVSYWPEHSGIGPYSAAAAEHLASLGAQVTVLCGMPHYPSWRMEPGDRRTLSRTETHAGTRLVRLRQFVPRRQNVVSRGWYEASFLLHGLARRAALGRPDLVVAVTPALAGAAVGRHLARRAGAPFAVIVQDLVSAASEQSGLRGSRSVGGLVGRWERSLLTSASAVGVVHESFVARCRRMGVDADRIGVIPNWSRVRAGTADRSAVRAALGWDGRKVALHAGNMGYKQGLEVVVEAACLAQDRDPDTLFVLLGDGNQRDRLTALAGDVRSVEFRDPVSDAEFPELLAAADVLLVTQRSSVMDMSIPSKLTSYFAARRPVVASVAAACGTAQEVRRSGGGIVVDPEDPAALLDGVQALSGDPERSAALASAGRAYAEDVLGERPALERLAALVRTQLPAAAS